MLETERQSAAKSKVHFGKVQRLPEEFSLLNNRQERPAPSMKDEDIVHTSQSNLKQPKSYDMVVYMKLRRD